MMCFGRCRRNLRLFCGSVHLQRTGGLALAGARRGVAQAAGEVAGDLVGVGDEVATALVALGHGQHAVVDELDQAPGAGDRQQGLEALVSAPAGLAQPERYRQGGYVRRLPEDPWGNPYRYRRQSAHGQQVDVFSLGADGKEGGEGNDADLGNWQG